MTNPAPRTDITGPHGRVEYVPLPDDVDKPQVACHLVTYLVTSPGWHPLWHQYSLSVVRLDDYPGLPPATRKFDGATHELMVVAINPDDDGKTVTRTREDMIGYNRDGRLPFLTPVNIAEQFEATDDEMDTVAWLAARAVVEGRLNPETADAPTRVREAWLTACTKTLAHIRGEDHAQ